MKEKEKKNFHRRHKARELKIWSLECVGARNANRGDHRKGSFPEIISGVDTTWNTVQESPASETYLRHNLSM